MEYAPQRNILQRCVAVVAVFAMVGCSLQGCMGGEETAATNQDQASSMYGDENVKIKPVESTFQVDEGDKEFCDGEIKFVGEHYHDTVKLNAAMYVDKVDQVFGGDFLRYPYCVQIDHKLVQTMQHFINNDPQLSELSTRDKNNKIDDFLLKAFHTLGDFWRGRLEYECKRQIAHEISNMDMVRRVLKLQPQDITDDDLEQQIESAWRDQPLWEFFVSLRKSGCVRRYTSTCMTRVQGVNSKIHGLVQEAGGASWFAPKDPDDPDDDMGPVDDLSR